MEDDSAMADRGVMAGSGFIADFMVPELSRLRAALGHDYPRVILIFGNDDPRSEEEAALGVAGQGIWEYAHERRIPFGDCSILGYSCIPPSPFLLKDWERYDVSRHVPPGAISPEEGYRSVPADPMDMRYGTIQKDLELLAGPGELTRTIFLCHCPPYDTPLDRAALDGVSVDHVPLDVHIGSIAVRRFIEARHPLVSLHGHVHESARLTGEWRSSVGRTVCLSAAHDGPELALVEFSPESPESAIRQLL